MEGLHSIAPQIMGEAPKFSIFSGESVKKGTSHLINGYLNKGVYYRAIWRHHWWRE